MGGSAYGPLSRTTATVTTTAAAKAPSPKPISDIRTGRFAFSGAFALGTGKRLPGSAAGVGSGCTGAPGSPAPRSPTHSAQRAPSSVVTALPPARSPGETSRAHRSQYLISCPMSAPRPAKRPPPPASERTSQRSRPPRRYHVISQSQVDSCPFPGPSVAAGNAWGLSEPGRTYLTSDTFLPPLCPLRKIYPPPPKKQPQAEPRVACSANGGGGENRSGLRLGLPPNSGCRRQVRALASTCVNK